MCAQYFGWKFIRCEFAFTVFLIKWKLGKSSQKNKNCFYLFFPHTNLMISICFPLNWSKKKNTHCKLRIWNCSANQAPSILNQITIEIGWFHSALRLSIVALHAWNLIIYFCSIFSQKTSSRRRPLSTRLVRFICSCFAFRLIMTGLERGRFKGRRRLRFFQTSIEHFQSKLERKSEINDSTNRTMRKKSFCTKFSPI